MGQAPGIAHGPRVKPGVTVKVCGRAGARFSK